MADYRCIICGAEARIVYSSGPLCEQHDAELREWSSALSQHLTAETGGPTPVPLCPRRREGLVPSFAPDVDHYEFGHGLISQTHAVKSCSYCGSMNPDDFVQAVIDGVPYHWSDKRYKVYVTLPSGEAKFYTMHLTDEHRDRLREHEAQS